MQYCRPGQGGGGAGTPACEPLCVHFNVHTTWGLKSDTQSAYFGRLKSYYLMNLHYYLRYGQTSTYFEFYKSRPYI